MLISALVQAHNEERYLPGCLASLQWAGELVVADAASTDATRAIALSAGARVIDVPATGVVEFTRNQAIQQCRGEWIILVDADERVAPGLAERVRALCPSAEESAFWIPRKDYFLGQWMEHGFWPDYQLRLFRRERVRWPAVVHGHPEIQGRVGRLPADPALALEHPGYGDDLGRFIAKNTRYAPLDAGRVAADLRPPVWPYLVRRPLGEFTGRYIRCQAWRHGMVGLVWSLLMAHYQLLVGIHYWALSRQGQPEALDPSALRRSVRWQVIREGLKWLRR